MKTIIIPLFAGLALLAQTPAAKNPAAKTPAASAAKKAAPAAAPAGPNRALLNPAALKAKAPEMFKAKFTTGKGDFVIEVHREWAPLGADRFYNLVKNGFFDNAAFFRVISGFMVQFGVGPNPAVNKAWEHATIVDDPVKQSNTRGFVTFAKTGMPNSRSTQLFINFGDNARLDGDHFSPFGKVIEGMDVVDKLYAGYGEGAPGGAGPEQGRITDEGKPYLDKNFPLLDSIKMARLVAAPAPTPVAKPAVAAPKPAITPKPAVPVPAKK